MNKKILLIVTALLAVSLVATPLLVSSRKTKADITMFGYDFQAVETETEQVGRWTVKRTHWNIQLVALGPAVPGMLPMTGGTIDGWMTQKFNPETGFGKVSVVSTWDFGEYGSFKCFGSGKCGGIIPLPGNPLVAWASSLHYYGWGRDALKGVRLEFVSFPQISLPDNPLVPIPDDFVGTMGFCAVGEIIY